METKNKEYSIDEKEKLAKLCLKYEEEYDNHDTVKKYNSKKRKESLLRLPWHQGFYQRQ